MKFDFSGATKATSRSMYTTCSTKQRYTRGLGSAKETIVEEKHPTRKASCEQPLETVNYQHVPAPEHGMIDKGLGQSLSCQFSPQRATYTQDAMHRS